MSENNTTVRLDTEDQHRWPTWMWLATRLAVYIFAAIAAGLIFVIAAGLWKVVSHG